MSYFSVDIFTPSSVIVRNLPGDSVKVPTYRGEINILPEHTHIVTTIEAGILSVTGPEGSFFYALSYGICKVLKHKITILSRTVERSDAIDETRAKAALEKAKAKLASDAVLTEEEYQKFQRKVARAEVRLKVALMSK